MELLTLFNLCNKKKKLFLSTKSSRLTFTYIANVNNTKQVSDWFPVPGTKTFAASSLVRILRILAKTAKSRPSCACHFGPLALHDFVGWNEQGEENATQIMREKRKEKSSQDILNEVLVFDNELLKQLEKKAYYVGHKDGLVYVKPEMRFRILAYPYGRCLVLSPPTENISKIQLGALYLELHTSGLGLREEKSKVKIFFMEKSSSLLLYPNEMEMNGVKPHVRFGSDNNYEIIAYRVKISRAFHVWGNPLYDCAFYTIDNSYNDCVQNEVLEFFDNEIDCQPPLLAKEPSLMCNRKFNVTSSKAEKISD